MTKKQTILIVDDDKVFCEIKTQLLEKEGFLVESINRGKEVLDKLKNQIFDLLLLDFNLEDSNGMDILQAVIKLNPELPVIMVTAHATLENAVMAIKLGAYDYISKMSDQEEIIIKVKHALDKRTDKLKIKILENTLAQRFSLGNIIGKNIQMQEVYKLVGTVSDTDVPVLIKGETGTGKELIAKGIHFNSSRRTHPFIAINCAAIHENLMESELFGHEKGAFTGAHIQRKGKLEEADGGSIFLDEIGDLPIGLQAKLLRFLEDKHFERLGGNAQLTSDVRIISATNKNISAMIKENTFREDLFYRINVVEIQLPPLRDRLDDMPLLLDHFLNELNKKYKKGIKGFSQDAVKLFCLYNWPGNVRELEHLVEKLVLLTDGTKITDQDVMKFLKVDQTKAVPDLPTETPWAEYKKTVEKNYIIELLKNNKGNITEAARKSGLDRKSIYDKMEQYSLDREDFVA